MTITEGATMVACRGGAPKYATDILHLYEFVIALCLTLTNLPFVITLTPHNTHIINHFLFCSNSCTTLQPPLSQHIIHSFISLFITSIKIHILRQTNSCYQILYHIHFFSLSFFYRIICPYILFSSLKTEKSKKK